MGKLFGARLRKHREARGLSGNKLAQLSGISQANVNGIELGRRPPSAANLEALAGVPELAISLDQLQAWAAADKVGDEGLAKLRKYVLTGKDLVTRYRENESQIRELLDERERLVSEHGSSEMDRLSVLDSQIGLLESEKRDLLEHIRVAESEISTDPLVTIREQTLRRLLEVAADRLSSDEHARLLDLLRGTDNA